MTDEQLPELFQYYWMMQEKLPKQQTPSNKDSLSKEWNDFLFVSGYFNTTLHNANQMMVQLNPL
jgi:hypothetical protein